MFPKIYRDGKKSIDELAMIAKMVENNRDHVIKLMILY
jgi:hypothetical protein